MLKQQSMNRVLWVTGLGSALIVLGASLTRVLFSTVQRRVADAITLGCLLRYYTR